MKKDPVCGMDVEIPARYSSPWRGETYVFCSKGCQLKFDAGPSKYAAGDSVPPAEKPDFTPLVLIFAGILALAFIKYRLTGASGMADAMYDFMGIFFVVFAGFKLLDVKGFAEAYATYDIVAKKSRVYAFVYPFLELALGVAYLTRFNPDLVNGSTLVLMSVSSVGVIQILKSGRKIQCACLGTRIKLPMTKITLFEDVLMAVMAFAMLWTALI